MTLSLDVSGDFVPAVEGSSIVLRRDGRTILRYAELHSWDAERLDRWACGLVPGSGAFHAAAFCSSVYNADAPWQCGPFDLQRALGTWDAAHRAAFLAWVRAPWWP